MGRNTLRTELVPLQEAAIHFVAKRTHFMKAELELWHSSILPYFLTSAAAFTMGIRGINLELKLAIANT